MRKAFLLLGVCPHRLIGAVDYSNPESFDALLSDGKYRISLYYPKNQIQSLPDIAHVIKEKTIITGLHEQILSMPASVVSPNEFVTLAIAAAKKDGIEVVGIVNGCYVGASAPDHTIKIALPVLESTVLEIATELDDMVYLNVVSLMHRIPANA